jgi:hypothetical protein
MKKFIVAILAFLYLGVSSGIAMEIHYCMGKKAGVELFASGNDKCGKCGMKEKKGGCCSDEQQFYKLNDSHKNVSNDLSFEMPVAIISSSFKTYQWAPAVAVVASTTHNNSPPPDTGPSACILHCVFRL